MLAASPLADFFPLSLPAASPWSALTLAAWALGASLLLARQVVRLPRQIDADRVVHFPPAQRLLFSTVCAALGAACGWRWGVGLTALAALAFVLGLITLGWTDALSGLLPDGLTQPLLWLGLLVNLHSVFARLPDAVLGAVAGYVFFWLMYQLFWWATRREALGHGDFKLLAAMGAWLGWEPLLMLVPLASTLGIVLTLLRRGFQGQTQGGQMNAPLYFGPYLAAAGIFQLFWLFW